MRRLHRARWVLPVARPPIPHGWVAIENGLVVGVGAETDPPPFDSGDADAGDVAILPGLVNAHTHLELSWMRGQVPPASAMPEWVVHLMGLRRTIERDPVEPIVEAIREARAAGTALVGDITNSLAPYGPLAESALSAVVFLEMLGFGVSDPKPLMGQARAQVSALPPAGRLRTAIVPHAPYSVSPQLMQAIASAAAAGPISIHLGESPEEVEFLRTGGGAWRDLLRRLGAWTDAWKTPDAGPVEYVAAQGLVNERLLAVHCVQLTDAELDSLAGAGATVITCPRSNRWTGVGVPPVERFYRSGVRVAVGTDSLASVEDLNLFSEMAMMRRLAPSVPAREIVASATRHGADALGFGRELGTIEAGKRAELIAVRLPGGVSDVEEYLLSGIQPLDVRWLGSAR